VAAVDGRNRDFDVVDAAMQPLRFSRPSSERNEERFIQNEWTIPPFRFKGFEDDEAMLWY
jgi:hypothetical protein